MATLFHLDPSGSLDDFTGLFETQDQPVIAAEGAEILGAFVTEDSANTFPRLPVREGERVLVTLARHPDAGAQKWMRTALDADPAWRDRVTPLLRPHLIREPESVFEKGIPSRWFA